MLASAAAEQDEAARTGIYRDILAKTMEDVPVLPLYADRLFLAHGNHVKGLVQNSLFTVNVDGVSVGE